MPPTSQSPVTERSQYDDFSSPSAKRKSSDPNDNNDGENGNKKRRRKVNHACVYCRRSHMTCDLQRPCARCVKRDIGHLCHDEPRDPPRRSKSEVGVAEIAPAEGEGVGVNGGTYSTGQQQPGSAADLSMVGGMEGNASAGGGGGGRAQLVQPQPVSPNQLQRRIGPSGAPGVFPQNFDWNNSGVHNQFHDVHHLHPMNMFNSSEATNEYNFLNDFLSTSLLDDGALYSNDDAAQVFMNDPLLATSSVNAALSNNNNAFPQLPQLQQQQQQQQQPPQQQQQQQNLPLPTTSGPPPPQTRAGEEISRPSSAFFPTTEQSRNKFYMTAADPAGMSSAEDRLHKLLKAKYDAGMLRPFNYVKGYARLNTYMKKHMTAESQVRILKQLERFRPKFREAMQSLTDMQLVLVEMWFERSLMEYDRVFASMAIPACCWRRTGEIFRGNREMAELINVPWEKLRDGKLAIHEVMEEESLVSYWEKFGAIAFDQSQKAILTSCALKIGVEGGGERKTGGGAGKTTTLKCCFSFTIRRDGHNIPSLIVGNFLPIRPRSRPSSTAR